MLTKALFPVAYVIFFLLFSCHSDQKDATKNASEFTNYLYSYTAGMQSVSDGVVVTLKKTPDQLDPESYSRDLFDISPKVNGDIKVVSPTRIEFIPSENLHSDCRYTVRFKIGALYNSMDDDIGLNFEFKTIEQNLSVKKGILKTDDGFGGDKMFYSGTLLTADVADNSEVENLLSATLNREKTSIRWIHKEGGRIHNFVIDEVKKQDEVGKLKLEWDGAEIGVSTKGYEEIEIPAIGEFSVMSMQSKSSPSDHIEIVFSDILEKNQKLEELIFLSKTSGGNLRFEIDKNVVRVWPQTPIVGEQRLTIYYGIKSSNFHTLQENYTQLIRFEKSPPLVRFIGKGVIVPSHYGASIPFEAISLRYVELGIVEIFPKNIHQYFQENRYDGYDELNRVGRLVCHKKVTLKAATESDFYVWNTYKINLDEHIQTKPGAIYRVLLRFKKSYSLFADNSNETEEQSLFENRWDSPGYYSEYYHPEGFIWRENENPEHISYYSSQHFAARNLFSSNLGIIAKVGSDNNFHVVINRISNAEPRKGVKVQFFDYQQQLIGESLSDNNGMVKIQLQRKPFMVIANEGAEYGYLRVDNGSALSVSNFNVQGKVIQNGIKGFIYGERGVWRPGDTLHLTFVMDDITKQLPKNHPVILELFNSRGQKVLRKVATNGVNGFYAFLLPTQTDDPTGKWRAKVAVGGSTFSKQLKVETVKPNRLKIDFNLPDLIKADVSQTVLLKAQWLHGAIARNLDTRIMLSYVKAKTSFDKYPKYSFDDLAASFSPYQETFSEGKLDDKGEVNIPVKLKKPYSAPGMLKAVFSTRVFENGGDYSINTKSVNFAPFNRFVGLKLPELEDDWLTTEKEYPVKIVAVNPEGKSVTIPKITVELYKLDWRWWWESNDNHLARYVTGSSRKPVQKWQLKNWSGKDNFRLKIPYRNWESNGRYLLRIVDDEGGHAASVTLYASKWGGWASDGDDKFATVLNVKTDKETYQVGDKVEVSLPAVKNGRALVSIENGSRITDIFWVDTKGEKVSKFRFKVTAEMAPNVYVNVSLLQSYGTVDNDAPLRLYGMTNIIVKDPNTILNPEITTEKEYEPEKPFSMRVSEKEGKQMNYTLAIVDEGLLDLTGYKTPNIHTAFYAREALGVKTWDMYNEIAGAYGANLEQAFAIGGDEGQLKGKTKKEQRFKPVVFYAGPFQLKKGETKAHKFTMPNYLGSVKVMVVAGENGAYGKTDKVVPVRTDLMVMATVPRVLGPGERCFVPVNLFKMRDGKETIEVRIETNENIKIIGDKLKTVSMIEAGEEMLFFEIETEHVVGSGKITVVATNGKASSKYDVNFDIRNPNPKVVLKQDTLLAIGNIWNSTLIPPGAKGDNMAYIELYALPMVDWSRYMEMLTNYPHGCLEQTTSAVFPQLFLPQLMSLKDEEQLEVQDNIMAGLNRLVKFQGSDGGFVYWPGGSYISEWATSYAGHFLIMAEKKGYSLPIGMKENWLNYQKSASRSWYPIVFKNNRINYNNYYQTYRLYTLALAGKPEVGAMNRLREKNTLKGADRLMLAAAYGLIGQEQVGLNLIDNMAYSPKAYRETGHTYGSHLRDMAIATICMFDLKQEKEAFVMLKKLTEKVAKENWLSTQTASWILMAQARAIEKLGEDLSIDVAIESEVLNTTVNTTFPVAKIDIPVGDISPIDINIKNNGKAPIYVNTIIKGAPITGKAKDVSSSLAMDVSYFNMDNKPISVNWLTQGTDFYVDVTIRNTDALSELNELALTTVFPSGWEIINNRLNDTGIATEGVTIPEYQDIRDDRVFTYFDLPIGGKAKFRVYLSAAYLGRFYLPAVAVNAMYDDNIFARKGGKWIEVVK